MTWSTWEPAVFCSETGLQLSISSTSISSVTFQYAYSVIIFYEIPDAHILSWQVIIEMLFLCEVIEERFGVCLGQATCVAAARVLLRIRVQFSLRLLQFQNVYALM